MANLHLTAGDSAPTPDWFPREGEGRDAEGSGPAGCRQWLLSAVTGPLPGPAYLPATGGGDRQVRPQTPGATVQADLHDPW